MHQKPSTSSQVRCKRYIVALVNKKNEISLFFKSDFLDICWELGQYTRLRPPSEHYSFSQFPRRLNERLPFWKKLLKVIACHMALDCWGNSVKGGGFIRLLPSILALDWKFTSSALGYWDWILILSCLHFLSSFKCLNSLEHSIK